MKILILGASGFIGGFCFDYFSKKYQVVGVDIKGRNKALADPDFSLTKTLIEKEKFDVVLNCAGSSDVRQSFVNPQHDFMVNVLYVQKVTTALRDYSPTTKFITISSASVYGNPTSLPVNENAPEAPLSPYAFHKLMSEKIIAQYAQLFGTRALSVRIFSAYGPGLKRQFFYDLYCKFISQPGKIELAGTGAESRDFVYIDDIARAFETLMQQGVFDGSVYNLAGGEESFIDPTAQLFAGICGYTGGITFSQKQFAGYPLNWRADISKLKALGFVPTTKLQTGLKMYYNWILENPNDK